MERMPIHLVSGNSNTGKIICPRPGIYGGVLYKTEIPFNLKLGIDMLENIS